MTEPGAFSETIVELCRVGHDPLIPPRIHPGASLDELKASLKRFGLLQPLIARPVDAATGVDFGLIAGSRRLLAMRELGWTEARVRSRALSDEQALALALDTDEHSQPRTRLEHAWFYARLAASGMEQKEIARAYRCSAGKASMYVRVGAALPPDRFTNAGVSLENAATIAITRLSEIVEAPEDTREQLLLAAAAAAEPEQSTSPGRKPDFSYRIGPKGRWCATGASAEVASWDPAERSKLISTVGPLVDLAREADGVTSPREARLLGLQEASHTLALLALREQHAAEVREYTGQILRLATAAELAAARGQPSTGGGRSRAKQVAAIISEKLRRLVRTVQLLNRTRPD
jgi:ParB/RepB/Spo0J family partition protein